MPRKAARRTGAGAGADGHTAARASAPGPPGRFTARAIVLGVVLLALVLSCVFPGRVYLAQRAEIAAMEEAQEQQRAHIEALATEAARWEDDEYIKVQARKRLHFAEPDEQLLVTVEDEAPAADGSGADPSAPEEPSAWWDRLWDSVESANRGGAGEAPEAGGAGEDGR